MKLFALLGLLFALLTTFFSPIASSAVAAPCPNESVVFQGATAEEIRLTCSALEKTKNFFSRLNVDSKSIIHFYFADEVLTPPDAEGRQNSVYGYFDTDDNSIHMAHIASPQQTSRLPWSAAWDNDVAESFLIHEISHLIAIESMGTPKTLQPLWHELLAYSVQFHLMNDKLREKILAFNPGVSRYETVNDVSAIAYEMDPDIFSIKAYLSVKAWGLENFLVSLMKGQIPPSRRI